MLCTLYNAISFVRLVRLNNLIAFLIDCVSRCFTTRLVPSVLSALRAIISMPVFSRRLPAFPESARD